MPDRRSPSTEFGKWIGLTVGLFSIIGVLVGAGISYGQHLRADEDQDSRLSKLEERLKDLERAERFQHGDVGQLPHAPQDKAAQ